MTQVASVDVDGLTVGYRRAGAGRPLLLLHGGWCDSTYWHAEMGFFAAHYDTVAWDAPGCGASGLAPTGWTIHDYARCLAAFVTTLGLDRPHVVGHSFGGGLALALYDVAPDAPASLVLADAYAGWLGSLGPEEASARLASVRADTPDATVMAEAFAAADLRDVLPQVAVPTLLLHGERDDRAPRRVHDALAGALRAPAIAIIEGAGHEVFHDDPAACRAAVLPFLASVDAVS